MMKIEPSPPAIVEDGCLQLGAFELPLRTMNLLDADILGGPQRRRWRDFRLKEWVGWGIDTPDIYFSMIIQDTKYLASSAFYAYLKMEQRYFEHSRPVFDRKIRVADTMYNDSCLIDKPGYRISFEHRLDDGRHLMEIEIDARKKAPAVEARIELFEDCRAVRPLVVSLPMKPHHYIYTHKIPMPAKGYIEVGGTRYELKPERDLANIDEHKGFYPYKTYWRWGTFAAYDKAGRVVAVNLSDQDTTDHHRYNENCIWLGDSLSLLGQVFLEFDERNPGKPWTIHDDAGRVELEFFPEGRKVEKLNLLLVGVDYFQNFGKYRGFLIDDHGAKHEVKHYYGVAERMDTRF